MCKNLIRHFCFLITLIFFLPLAGQVTEQIPSQEIFEYFNKEGFQSKDFEEMKISYQYYTASMDMHHIFYQQYYLDIPVESAVLNIGFKSNRLVHANNSFVRNIANDISEVNSSISAHQGLRVAIDHIGKETEPIPSQIRVSSNSRNVKNAYMFEPGTVSKKDIKVSLVWIKDGKSLKLCWKNDIEVAGRRSEIFQIMIDARTGVFVKKLNKVITCDFGREGNSGNYEISNSNREINNSKRSLSNTYNVFDLPVESPNHGDRSLSSNPWDRAGAGNPANTLGWHDDGTSTYTTTKGNNVYAYEDRDANDIPGYSPDGGVSLDFDFPLDFSLSAVSNEEAAITNLFHTCNLAHDIFYQYGFDEQAGNFQNDNLGRGGTGGDYLLAEAMDGFDTNSASFLTDSDGIPGRMEMFLWSSVTPPPELMVNSPMSINSSIPSAESAFSDNNKLIDIPPITGNVVLVEDLFNGTHKACSSNPINNGAAIAGNIALIDRGSCLYAPKVKNAQNAGAIAVIVINSDPSEGPRRMTGSDNSINIPAVMISSESGQELKTALMSETVNITMTGGAEFTPDASFDNGIIVHEYGHGVSARLTGGPAEFNCLYNNEMKFGEGWGDYFGLMLTTDWSQAAASDKRDIGTFPSGNPPNGNGSRIYPYTTNMVLNPLTYGDVASSTSGTGNPLIYSIGTIWASMLWDMTWNIIDIEGASTDMYHGTGGNNIALQLVIDGLKLQVCKPGFVDARDAILLADELNYGGKYKCAIWNAFARRGLGISATQGNTDIHTDGVEAFDLPGGVILSQYMSSSDVYEGELLTVDVVGTCQCSSENNYQVKHDIPAGYEIVSISNGSQVGNQIVSNTLNLAPSEIVNLQYTLQVTSCSSSPDDLQLIDDIEAYNLFDGGNLNKRWVVSSNQSNSPSNSWYGQNFGASSNYSLQLLNPLQISGPTILSFYHRFQTEKYFDGGVIEISTNFGVTWEDLGAHFISNGYPSTIFSFAGTSLSGRKVFTGDSDQHFATSSFVKSEIDLSSYDGEVVTIRFRMVCDVSNGGPGINGWYIDDIEFKQISGFIAKGYLYEGSTLKDVTSKSVKVNAFGNNKIYVDPMAEGSRYGGDWANALHFFQNAFEIAECSGIDTILLAKGTYFPFNQRDSSFVMKSNMVIIGGFPTGGGLLINRDIVNYQTILSGDIGAGSDNSDNNYHVVYCGAGITNAVLDGLVIEKGNANGGEINNEGAAILNLGSLTLNNVSTKNNLGTSAVHNRPGATLILKGNSKIEE